MELRSGRYAVAVSPCGTGHSSFDGIRLNDWRPDPVEELGGFTLYVRDLDTREFWTVSGPPVPGQQRGSVRREGETLSIARTHADVHALTRVQLDGEVELRSCEFENAGTRERRLEITSFVELVLNHPAAHDAHPAFSKLFVQTAWRDEMQALVATRRPRGADETWPCAAHLLLDAAVTDWLSDRPTFLGRGGDALRPRAQLDESPLGRCEGNVLDPALSLRTVLRLAPGASARVCFALVAAASERELDATLARLRAAHPVSERAPRGGSPARAPESGAAAPDLKFWNGHGGFTHDGREYVLRLEPDANGRYLLPPAPWTNVVANRDCGFVVSETGAGTTWSSNSREHRLTPWRNDAVTDPHGDALYVRDTRSGAYWSLLPGPAPSGTRYEVRHGFGYTSFAHEHDGLAFAVTLYVPAQDAIRVARVRVRNVGTQARTLHLHAYNQWVLGDTPENTRRHVQSRHLPRHDAIVAWRTDLHAGPEPSASRPIAFAAADAAQLAAWWTDRRSYLGAPGSMRAPLALVAPERIAALADGDPDPCAALAVQVELAPGADRQVAFLLGESATPAELDALLHRWRMPGAADAEFARVREEWSDTLGRLQVETPEPALDCMLNGWLAYQNLSCRIRGRTAFYQSGGAFGFRDQLQDAAALVLLRPELTREQVVLHASHQFVEGDVLHWWHPPLSRGIRTRFADDLLWLPWIAAYYVRTTRDLAVLEEVLPYLRARPLEPGEDETFLRPERAGESGTLYEHCCRAIDRSLAVGVHGLPLFGTGDWNDGMNRVGREGRGESVWMGFFLHMVLGEFLPFCEARGDAARVATYRAHREALGRALNADGWDGAWYRRGWYDDGAVLGSSASDECRIDALVQAWSVMSGAAPADRARSALDSLETHLVDDAARIVRLLAPPFVATPHDPGYIKGYVAGVRENGGQYTHAATWVVRAMAEAGRRDRAMQLMKNLLPMTHSSTPADAARYKVEPYVIAADVYGVAPHVGRGGWTWYTGSAGWVYRVGIESLLGFRIEGGRILRLAPRVPDDWPGYSVRYACEDGSRIELRVANPRRRAERVVSATLDGQPVDIHGGELRVYLPQDGREHAIVVTLGE